MSFCQHPDNRVLESRSAEAGQSVRRRRECLKCGHRFTTYERIEFVPVIVLKRGGERESFDRSRLLRELVRACDKTQVEERRIERVVDEIEAELQQRVIREVTSPDITKLALQHLRSLSEVAYIRYASLYCQFDGIQDFVGAIESLHDRVDEPENSNPRDSEAVDAVQR
ncbi:MAG: transcriptional regulator NrdR [Leptolyngbyaceae cyanobacterium SU_3_3]|nr:transcriptional regulator NrdR [Leptolyngbyaceae cyanobacterium SU_3_3]